MVVRAAENTLVKTASGTVARRVKRGRIQKLSCSQMKFWVSMGKSGKRN